MGSLSSRFGHSVRSCWDYQHRIDEFLAWVDRLDAAHIPILNDAAAIRWNASKTYLADLAATGIPVPPLRIVRRGARDDQIVAAVDGLSAADVVVKPAVSASAYATWRATMPFGQEDIERVRTLAVNGDVIVQSFVESIVETGEFSLVFFNGEYSHAARKVPKAGDFRVQQEFGGRLEIEEVASEVIDQARRVLERAPSVPVYARVDGIVVDGIFTLMELELIEPELYLTQATLAAPRFASAIATAIRRG